MFIKPDDLFDSIENFKSEYKELYEMYEYLDKSRDGYISEVYDLRDENKKLERSLRYFLILLFFMSGIILFVCIL